VALADFERCALEAGIRDPLRLVDRAARRAGVDRRVRFLGHASVAIPLASGLLVSDPVPPSCNPAARGLADVRLIVISHGHPDHLSPEALLSLLPMRPTVIVPAAGSGTPYDPALKSAVAALGFADVVELRPYESFVQDDVTVRALPFLGEHGSLAIDSKAVFEVRQEQRSIILAADATGLDPQVLASCADAASDVCLVIGIEAAGARSGWLYGPLLGKSPGPGVRCAGDPDIRHRGARIGTRAGPVIAQRVPGRRRGQETQRNARRAAPGYQGSHQARRRSHRRRAAVKDQVILGYSGLDGSAEYLAGLGVAEGAERRIFQGMDSAAAIFVNGELRAAVQQERFSGVKFDHQFPADAMRWCLSAAGVTARDVAAVAHGFAFGPYERLYSANQRSAQRYRAVYSAESQQTLLRRFFPAIADRVAVQGVRHHG
jgi:hypothetical protein